MILEAGRTIVSWPRVRVGDKGPVRVEGGLISRPDSATPFLILPIGSTIKLEVTQALKVVDVNYYIQGTLKVEYPVHKDYMLMMGAMMKGTGPNGQGASMMETTANYSSLAKATDALVKWVANNNPLYFVYAIVWHGRKPVAVFPHNDFHSQLTAL